MSKRISARAPKNPKPLPPLPVQPKPAPPITTEQARDRTLALIKREGAKYSVDVAIAVGISIGRAKKALIILEDEGLLRSWLEPSPGSGLKRRYYDLKGKTD